MSQSRGKKFEYQIREDFEKVTNVSVDRIPDQTMRYKGAVNVSDLIVYKEPYEYYVECKSVQGASLPFTNIKDGQWEGLVEKSKIQGVLAGILVWFVDKDVTLFIPIQVLQELKNVDKKSVRFDIADSRVITLIGKKKRTFFSYDMCDFFEQAERVVRDVNCI